MERKIEKAMEEHLKSTGWSIRVSGDHFAEWFDDESGIDCIINVTELAKAVAEELA